jgi:deoxyhypusine synthase
VLKLTKKDLLKETIKHIDITQHPGIVGIVQSMEDMAFSSRDLYRAADIYDRMLRDPACTFADDAVLRNLHIDRIYDTFIDEDELRVCDDTVREIVDSLDPRPHSFREIIREMAFCF